jgi:hypothetical protein
MSYRLHSSLLYKTDQPALMSHYYSLPMYNYYQVSVSHPHLPCYQADTKLLRWSVVYSLLRWWI